MPPEGKTPASGRLAKGIVEMDHVRTAEFDVIEAPQPQASWCTQGRRSTVRALKEKNAEVG